MCSKVLIIAIICLHDQEIQMVHEKAVLMFQEVRLATDAVSSLITAYTVKAESCYAAVGKLLQLLECISLKSFVIKGCRLLMKGNVSDWKTCKA